MERLREHSYLCLEKCIDIATESYAQHKADRAVKMVGDSYLKLAEYVQHHNDKNLYYVSEIGLLHFDDTKIQKFTLISGKKS